MKAEYILQADLLDIIFENRNQNYGAYELRKHYTIRLYKAICLIISSFAILCLYILMHKPMLVLPVSDIFSVDEIAPAHPKKIEPKVKPVKATEYMSKHLRTNSSTSKIFFVDSLKKINPIQSAGSVGIANSEDSLRNEGKQNVSNAIVNNGVNLKDKLGDNRVSKFVNPDDPGYDADIMPSYPGGIKALTTFMEKNLNNPNMLDVGSIISVQIRFIVGYDGLLKKFEIIKNGGEEFNNEVIRVLKKMPAWIPGKTKGENVSVYYSIPVKFIMQE